MNRILLVQHCQSQHHLDRERRFPDQRNGLTELGYRQAQAVAKRLTAMATGRDVRLYTSDMTRAHETARIVGSILDRQPILRPELREWSDPHALNRTSSPPWTDPEPDGNIFDWRPYPEHETWREFLHRVADFMNGLAGILPDDALPVLIVHGGTLSNIVVWWLRLPLDHLPEFTCFAATPGSLSILEKNPYGNPVVERLNDQSHLDALTSP